MNAGLKNDKNFERFIFYRNFRFTEKLRERFREIYTHIPAIPNMLTSDINTSQQSGTFITSNEPTLTHYYHPKFIVYITIYSIVFYILWVWTNI